MAIEKRQFVARFVKTEQYYVCQNGFEEDEFEPMTASKILDNSCIGVRSKLYRLVPVTRAKVKAIRKQEQETQR